MAASVDNNIDMLIYRIYNFFIVCIFYVISGFWAFMPEIFVK